MARRSSAVRLPVLPVHDLAVDRRARRPSSGAWMPSIALASVDFAGARLADEPERLAVREPEVDADERRHVVAGLAERLGHVARSRARRRWLVAASTTLGVVGRQDLVDPVGMVAARPTCRTDFDDRRRPRRDRSSVRADSGRRTRMSADRRADLRATCRGSSPAPLALADAVAGQRSCSRPTVYGCCGSSNTCCGGALFDDLAGIHHADPVAHRADHAEVVGDQQDRGVGLGCAGRARGRAPRPRRWRRDRWSARRARAASGRMPAPSRSPRAAACRRTAGAGSAA